ncbi:ferredoxin [Candidatus Woesearchaeota archaeon]|nr:ferredoxin [Candidatus Woesearchaeota archaeon]
MSDNAKLSKEKRFRVVFDRKNCIGAAACAAVAPEFWEMKEDGKADLIGHKVDEQGNQVLILAEHQMTPTMKKALELNKEAAEVCPVQVIHIYDDETGEKLI